MRAAALLAEVEAAGLTVQADALGRLVVAPKGKLPPELRARLVIAKPEILMLLQRTPCIECGSRLWTVALDGVCHDCITGLTQLRRNGAAI